MPECQCSCVVVSQPNPTLFPLLVKPGGCCDARFEGDNTSALALPSIGKVKHSCPGCGHMAGCETSMAGFDATTEIGPAFPYLFSVSMLLVTVEFRCKERNGLAIFRMSRSRGSSLRCCYRCSSRHEHSCLFREEKANTLSQVMADSVVAVAARLGNPGSCDLIRCANSPLSLINRERPAFHSLSSKRTLHNGIADFRVLNWSSLGKQLAPGLPRKAAAPLWQAKNRFCKVKLEKEAPDCLGGLRFSRCKVKIVL